MPHDSQALQWVDLSSGGHNMAVHTGGSWEATCFVSNPAHSGTATLGTNIENIITIECVCVFNSVGPGRVAVQLNRKNTYTVVEGSRWCAIRANSTINFVGTGKYFTAPSTGTSATFSGVFSSVASDTVAGYLNGQSQTLTSKGMYGLGTPNYTGVSPFGAFPMDGKIFCIRAYNRALSAETGAPRCDPRARVSARIPACRTVRPLNASG